MEPIELTVPDIDAQIEEKVNADVPFAIPGVDFTKLPTEFITLLNLIVKADRRNIYTAQAELDTKKDADFVTYKAQADHRIGTLQKDYNDLEQECIEIREELGAEVALRQQETAAKLQAIAERDELRTNRDNAATQLDEAQKEIDRLNSLVDDYQKAKVFGEREAQNIIEVEASETDAINNALQKLYTTFENWGSINKVYKPDGSFELVKNDALQNEWAPVPVTGGSESTDSFRDEAAEAGAEGSGVPATEDVVAPPPISETPFQGDLADGDTTVPEMVEDAPVTRCEFEALKRDVELLKQGQVGVAA